MERLAGSRDVQQCFTDQALRYAVLRDLEEVAEMQRAALMESFVGSDFRVRTLIREIALSPLIRFEASSEEGEER